MLKLKTVTIIIVTLLINSIVNAQQPSLKLEGHWKLITSLSDEFNGKKIDRSKWDIDPTDWGVWSWEPYNVKQEGGSVYLSMEYNKHQRGADTFYYKSGMIRTRKKFKYGYFEARIKGAPKFPGVCPSFWAKADTTINGKRVSAEIDVMEIQENKDIHVIDNNLHAFPNGGTKQNAVHQRRHWDAPWDPRDDFHTYGVEWSADSVKWYIDGNKVNAAANLYWKIPLNVISSLGLRPPMVIYDKRDPVNPEAVNRYANPEKSTNEGFPTAMIVDYIRVWQRNEDK